MNYCELGPEKPCPENEYEDNPYVLLARSDGSCLIMEDCPAMFEADPDLGEEWLLYAPGCFAEPPPPCPYTAAIPEVR